MIALLLVSCAEYTVSFEQQSSTPLPVVLSYDVEMPVGIVATAIALGHRNGEDDGGAIGFSVDDPGVLDLAPVDDADEWALVAVTPGTTTIWPTVGSHEAEPMDVVITDQ